MSASSPSGTRSRCCFCACCCSCCWCSRAPAGEFFASPNSLLPPPPARSSSTNNGGVQNRHRCQGALRCTAEQTPPAEKRPAADQRSRHSRPSNRSTTTPCPAAAAEARPHRTTQPRLSLVIELTQTSIGGGHPSHTNHVQPDMTMNGTHGTMWMAI